MIRFEDRKAFEDAIIAQDDDCDYSESGWVAVVVGDLAALANYGHCSCYDTWDDIGGDVSQWEWSGTILELIDLAKRDGDPHIPERTNDPMDYDYSHLRAVYDQILAKEDDLRAYANGR